METKDLKKIEKAHFKVQKGVFYTGAQKASGATLFWNDKITDFYWNYAGLINTKLPEELIKETIDFFKTKNRKPAFYLTPWTKPKNFENVLQNHGFKLAYKDAWQVYAGSKEIGLPSNLEIKEIKTKEEMDVFIDVFNKAFSGAPGDPYGALPKEYGETLRLSFGKKNWKNYLVYSDSKPVATGSLAIKGKYAGVYSIGTHPEFRKKGFGTAVVNFCIKEALAKGCEFIFLQTVKDSYNEKLYNKCGFETAFTGVCWTLE